MTTNAPKRPLREGKNRTVYGGVNPARNINPGNVRINSVPPPPPPPPRK